MGLETDQAAASFSGIVEVQIIDSHYKRYYSPVRFNHLPMNAPTQELTI